MNRRSWDVITFGETMWRLSPPGFGRLEEAVSLDVRMGGSESNTAIALARLGLRTSWWSKLPDNPLGHRIENEVRRWGVDTAAVNWDKKSSARAGLYFIDFGTSPRATNVHYDRANSSACTIRPDHVSVDHIENSRLLHLTGITTALSDSCAEAVSFAIGFAKDAGKLVSFDVNYRAKLWSPDAAKVTLSRILPKVDLLFCPESDAKTVFGIEGSAESVARQLKERFGVPSVVVTCSEGGARAIDDNGAYSVSAYPLGQIVDRIGAGDAFSAGTLFGYLSGDLPKGMEYGTAMAALKHTIPGDILIATRAEIEAVVAGAKGGVSR